MRRASGESTTGTQDTLVAHLWFTTGLRHHEADCGKLLSGKKGKDKGKGKHKGEHESSPKFEGYCGHCGN